MRTSALSVAILAFVTVPTNLSVADDFSALLADLSFGDAPAINQPLTVAATADPEELKQIEELKEAEELQPLSSHAFTMPGMLDSDAIEVAAKPEVDSAPQVALQDPIPASIPESSDDVNLDAAFALQDVQASSNDVPSRVVGHHVNHCDVQGCDSVITCRPHVKPNLPSSTLYQYFRSDRCYTHVWDGYRRNCGDNHKHLHGECDCFTNSSKGFSWSSALGLGCDRNDCGNCDVGCDR